MTSSVGGYIRSFLRFILHFSLIYFITVFTELFKSGSQIKIRERERERGNQEIFLNLKEEGTCQLFVTSYSVHEREIRNFIWIISFRGYCTGMEAAAPTILKINFDEEILYNTSHKLSVHLLFGACH